MGPAAVEKHSLEGRVQERQAQGLLDLISIPSWVWIQTKRASVDICSCEVCGSKVGGIRTGSADKIDMIKASGYSPAGATYFYH